MTNAPVQIREKPVERVNGVLYGAFTAAMLVAAGFLTVVQLSALYAL